MLNRLFSLVVVFLIGCGGEMTTLEPISTSADSSVTTDTNNTVNDDANTEDTNDDTADSSSTEQSNEAFPIQGVPNDNSAQTESNSGQTLRLVTWNIEHLAANNYRGCVARDDSDYAALQAFAETIEADVVGLQEVESITAIHRVFPASDWDAIISSRPHSGGYRCRQNGKTSTPQKVGFAIRKGVNYRHAIADNFSELAVNNSGLRYGVIIHLTDTQPETQVMSIHMKSGCFVDDYRQSSSSACGTFSRQAPVLEEWMEDQTSQQLPYVVLGDFNHQMAKSSNYFAQQLRDNPYLEGYSLLTADVQSCHPRYPYPIDHIVSGEVIANRVITNSAMVHAYGYPVGQLKESDMLSDHCPISVDIRL